MKKRINWLAAATGFFALLSVVFASTTFIYFQKLQKIQKNDRKSSLSDSQSKPDPKSERKATPVVSSGLEILGAEKLSSECGMRIHFSGRVDLEAVKEYVFVEPELKNGLRFSLHRSWSYARNCEAWSLWVEGDFPFGVEHTLKIRKGLPEDPKVSKAPGKLETDYDCKFTRPDLPSSVSFADKGRYLPPIGKRMISVDVVNVTNVNAVISKVPAGNIVHFLALYERMYEHIHTGWYGSRETFVDDLSGFAREIDIAFPDRRNVKQTGCITLDDPKNPGERGVYFVDISSSAHDGPNFRQCRVVAVSDLALNVRQTESKTLVWVTSLTTGKPVPGVKVNVYSSANVVLANGVTDDSGFCVCTDTEGLADTPYATSVHFAVVATTGDGKDSNFVSLTDTYKVNENFWSGDRHLYLDDKELAGFAWTDRGIYRHGEKVLLHGLVRNGKMLSPGEMPLEIQLHKPNGLYSTRSVKTDTYGAFLLEDIVIPDDQPSGTWRFDVKTPGENGALLYSTSVKVEDFVPPQIRVKVLPDASKTLADFAFGVTGEYLYGSAASGLKCEGAVVFEDAGFSPKGWKGWTFGDCTRSLKPNYRQIDGGNLDADGKATVPAFMRKDLGLPSAAVRAIVQGAVFDDTGRPAYARDSVTLHYYPYYIGTTLKSWMKRPEDGRLAVSVACVEPGGKRCKEGRNLKATVVKIDTVYSYENLGGESYGKCTWRCDYVRNTVADDIALAVPPSGDAQLDLANLPCGDYELSVQEPGSDVRFCSRFYVSDWGDDSVSAPLSNPSQVAITADKPFYRPGERPKLRIRSPFSGKALLGVFHKDLLHSEVITLTNATTEIELPVLTAAMLPNVDVSLSVVHGVSPGTNHLAARAHGETSLSVREKANEIDVKVAARHDDGTVHVSLAADGAEEAVVTVVDEGINILTGQKTPDPIAEFSKSRFAHRFLYDLYDRLLPLSGDDRLAVGGLKTGGGAGSDLLSRVSPVKSRRYKPLSLWRNRVKLKDGKADLSIDLPEFSGEVRVTALAYNAKAAGASSVQCKVASKLVVMPDAPRFVAPGDEFTIFLPMDNRAGSDGSAKFRISTSFEGGETNVFQEGEVFLKKDGRKLLPFEIKAPRKPGTLAIIFETSAFGEKHRNLIDLPVRPAVAWRQTSGVEVLPGGKRFKLPKENSDRFVYSVSESPASELKDSLEFLADYPHGCLEQTASRIMPLISAGGVLSAFSSVKAEKRVDYVKAGYSRVLSMLRSDGFVMWPDVNCKATDEVALYALHFIYEAKAAMESLPLTEHENARMLSLLRSHADFGDLDNAVYACHTLVIAKHADKGRMLSLYDSRKDLGLLSLARLARAFALLGDAARASELLSMIKAPSTVADAAFALLAMLETDPEDRRIPEIVKFLSSKRVKDRFSWGTTYENAHAVMALAEYFGRQAVTPGLAEVKEENSELVNIGQASAFVAWKRLDLPDVAEVKEESSGLKIRRDFFNADGTPYGISKAARGDYVVATISISSDADRTLSDLVVEDLFAGAFEPIQVRLDNPFFDNSKEADWVMRYELRDDRALVFSKSFKVKKGEEVKFHYPLRVVSAGTFALPGVAVEAMYQPELRANSGAGRIVVRD